jgi:lysophospholipase L1-like esterase
MGKMYFFIGLLFVSFTGSQKDPITVYLIGDSTMSIKEKSAYPETGWGMPFVHFFDSTVTIDNRAKNGRSTKSFMAENLWQPVVDQLQPGDYVLIQFGHNDEVKEKVGRYTTPQEYQANLRRYISDTRTKKAHPIMLTPVARRKFDDAGQLVDTHKQYAELVRMVAKETGTPLIDVDKMSQKMLIEFGPEKSTLLFLHLEPGEHPHYPEGIEDNTHFNELGARKVAQLVLTGIKTLEVGLAEHIVRP